MAPLFVLGKASLSLTLEQEMIFVRPKEGITEDPLLRGSAMLHLPRRRAVKLIRITLEALSDVFGGCDFAYESERLLEKTLETDLGGEVLEAGDHVFNFSFILQSNGPVFQRCSYGRTRHFIRAVAEYSGALNLKTSSAPIAIFVSANPSPPGEPPEPFEASIQHYSPDLGPIMLTLTSPHLTVASLVHAQVDFLAPPPMDVRIVTVYCYILQTFVVTYKDPAIVARPPTRRHYLTKVDTSALDSPLVPTASRPVGPLGQAPLDPVREDPVPVHILLHEEPYTYSSLFRVPNDDVVRPSTLPATETKIRVTHKIVVECRYKLPFEEEDRLLTVSRPVVIASCCCLADSYLLPAYSAEAPHAPILSPLRNRCLCSASVADMRTMEGLALERAATITGGREPAERATDLRVEREIMEQRQRGELKSAPGHLTAIHGRVED